MERFLSGDKPLNRDQRFEDLTYRSQQHSIPKKRSSYRDPWGRSGTLGFLQVVCFGR